MKSKFAFIHSSLTLIVFLSLGVGGAIGQDITWTNGAGDNDFHTVGNWDGGVVPEGTGVNAIINSTGDDRLIYDSVSNVDFSRLFVGQGAGVEGEVEIVGGSLKVNANSNHSTEIGKLEGVGTVNQSGGEASFNALYLASGEGAVGTYNLSGGTLIISRGRGGYSLFVGSGGTGTLEVSGGVLRTRDDLQLGLSGGEGVFSIVGSGATEIGIGSHGSVDGGWSQGAAGTLKLGVDDGGLTKIFVDDVENDGVGGDVTFAAGSLIDVEYIGSGELAEGSWVVMEWEGTLSDGGLTLSSEDAISGWSLAFEDRGVNGAVAGPDTLVLNYSPLVDGEHLIKLDGETLDVDIAIGDPSVVTVDGVEGVGSVVGNAIFSEGAVLDLSYSGDLVESSWTIFQWEGGLYNNGLALSPEAEEEGWRIEFEDNGVNEGGMDTLVLVYEKPEFIPTKTFNHPGLVHKRSDLDRAKFNIEAGLEPWASSFTALAANSYSSYDYIVRGDPSWDYLNRENPKVHGNEFQSDFEAAYQNSLMWYFTGDQRHADKAIEILNTWSNLKSVGGIPLGAGIYGHQMLQSAEIIRHTNAGWKEEDIKKFEDMLVYPGYSNTEAPLAAISSDQVTFYWKSYLGDSSRAGNQDASCYLTLMAIGVFLDNQIIYDRGLRYLEGLPHRADDLPYPSGPHVSTTEIGRYEFQIDWNYEKKTTIPDYGFDGVLTNYILPSGQCLESSRDQSHSFLGLSFLTRAAEIAWNQGDDLYGWADNRLLAGIEYHGRYNISDLKSFPDQTEPWEPTVENGEFEVVESRTGRTTSLAINPYVSSNVDRNSRGSACVGRPYFEMPLSHYKYRKNLDSDEYKWLQRIVDYNVEVSGGYETMAATTLDATGYGALAHRRGPGMAGDPVGAYIDGHPQFEIPFIPGVVEAENFDYYNLDAGGGEGYTYHDSDDVNSGGEYRIDDAVDVEVCSEGGYSLTDLQSGEWLTYTVHVPASGEYDISVRYAATSEEGALRFAFNGSDVTGDVSLPSTGGEANWSSFIVAEDVRIEKGVQAMKIFVSGVSDTIALNSVEIDLKAATDNPVRYEAENYSKARGIEVEDCADLDGGSNLTSIENGGIVQYNGVFLGTGSWLRFRVARSADMANGRIEVRIDDVLGDVLTTIDVPVTGGLQEWQTIETQLEGEYGVHSLYFFFLSEDSNESRELFNLNWFEVYVLDVPDDVRVEDLSTHGAELAWNPVGGATAYEVRRASRLDGKYELVGTVPSSSVRFTDSDMSVGFVYYYVVNSVHGDVNGEGAAALTVAPSGVLRDDEIEIELMPSVEGNALIFEVPNTVLGHRYVVQKTDDISSPDWMDASETIWGSGHPKQIEVVLDPESSSTFYRLRAYRF